MEIIAKKEFTLKGKYYDKDDIVKVNNFEELKMLNEKGFIKPLTRKELESYLKEEKKEAKKL